VIALQAAAVLCWISAVGFGLPNLPAIRSVAGGRDVPLLFGFPAYGGGPFERIGLTTTVPLLAAFLLVCALEAVAGWLLWGGHRSGAILALALVPVGLVFWIGFALPFGPIFALARTALIALNWNSLS
jgi:hypothetical protein